MKEKLKNMLPIIDLPLVILALYMIFMYVRPDATLGESQRIFYFHVSYAWIGFLSLFCNFVGSIMYLIKKDRFWDILAVSSAEIGIAFCLVVLTTGPIWGKAAWGAWWTWDPRLVTFLILTFIYVAYMVVRNSIDEETKRGRFSAVIGIVGFLNVPLTYVASHLWRTIHPNVIQPGRKWSMDNDMTMTLRVSIIAITILFIFLLLRRMDLEVIKDRLAELRKKIMKEA